MAVLHTFVDIPRESVWEALEDGRRYAEWVVGTRDIVSVDPSWPAVGAELEFVVGYGPFRFQDRTVVRLCEPGSRLELEIKAGRFGAIRVAFELKDWGAGTLVICDEHPLKGLSTGLEGPPTDVLLFFRNRVMLRNLAGVAEKVRQAERSTRA